MAEEQEDLGQKELQERADKIEELGYIPSDGSDLGPRADTQQGIIAEESGHLAPEAEDEAPNKSASREEWDEYARSQGVDPEEYSTKESLQEHFGV